ncbi:hypothetical protein ABGF48_01425 [Helcococcus bovis]|uniref:hypothetical protein n=1 Tax=Helcococcus bovis TaxID=3153252 RepID=UPI0038B89F06
MEKFELTDTKEKFELKINGVPINFVKEYKIEGTPYEKQLTIKFVIPTENIKFQSDF